MRITNIEASRLRIPDHNVRIADGIQADVIVRVSELKKSSMMVFPLILV
jgi:hypothetical protein